jgi:hypothetical protein
MHLASQITGSPVIPTSVAGRKVFQEPGRAREVIAMVAGNEGKVDV